MGAKDKGYRDLTNIGSDGEQLESATLCTIMCLYREKLERWLANGFRE